MSISPAAILWALMQLSFWEGDASQNGEQAEARLAPWAEAISAEALQENDAAAAIAVGWHESRWASYILEGRCLEGPVGMRCDPDAHGDPQSLGPWQLRRVACPLAWQEDPSPRVQAHCAISLLWYHRHRCARQHPAGDWAGAISGFNLGCDWPRAAARERTRRRVLGWLLAYP